MYDWFDKNGIRLSILSDTNPADKRFKRVKLEDI